MLPWGQKRAGHSFSMNLAKVTPMFVELNLLKAICQGPYRDISDWQTGLKKMSLLHWNFVQKLSLKELTRLVLIVFCVTSRNAAFLVKASAQSGMAYPMRGHNAWEGAWCADLKEILPVTSIISHHDKIHRKMLSSQSMIPQSLKTFSTLIFFTFCFCFVLVFLKNKICLIHSQWN